MNMEAVMPTLSEAKRIIEAAITRARELDVNISVAVCDISGRLIALNRMDGALWDVDRGSIGKAIAAAMTGRPSQELSERTYREWPALRYVQQIGRSARATGWPTNYSRRRR